MKKPARGGLVCVADDAKLAPRVEGKTMSLRLLIQDMFFAGRHNPDAKRVAENRIASLKEEKKAALQALRMREGPTETIIARLQAIDDELRVR